MLFPFRKGSVIADIELTFNEHVGESEVYSLLLEANKDGSLGQLQVDELSVGTTISGAITYSYRVLHSDLSLEKYHKFLPVSYEAIIEVDCSKLFNCLP